MSEDPAQVSEIRPSTEGLTLRPPLSPRRGFLNPQARSSLFDRESEGALPAWGSSSLQLSQEPARRLHTRTRSLSAAAAFRAAPWCLSFGKLHTDVPAEGTAPSRVGRGFSPLQILSMDSNTGCQGDALSEAASILPGRYFP